jgi:EAL domain-containing protein (putative c-di-GMP-specific phosphodiesterase class I)
MSPPDPGSSVECASSPYEALMAEGVETPEQLTFLRTEGCDYAQGFGLYRPMPAAAAGALQHPPAALDAA